ncbi:acetate--CoA ligase family protein [Sporosarcina sp. CAU 1771]
MHSYLKDRTISSLEAAFTPKSIAVIGASNELNKLGGMDLKLLIDSGYKGMIYPVNPKETIVQGYKAYSSVLDIQEEVDRASIILPTKLVLPVIKECAEKGVKVVQIYSSGFGELGEEGKKLEQEMLMVSKKYNMRIIGPNCIGTYCPASGISFTKGTSMKTGHTGFISQSGGITFDIVNRGEILGVRFSKAISVGNCIDLDHSDFLNYLSNDEETKVIGLYIESVKDGQRFLKELKNVTKKKPVVILKGGRTASGSQSVASHTGNLAGSYDVWEALFEQTGAIPVKNIEEMLTVLSCLQDLKPIYNGKVALVGNGGGATVLATDYLEEMNLQLADIDPNTTNKLTDLGLTNTGINMNPIDLPASELAARQGKLLSDILLTLCKDKEVNYLIFHLNLVPFSVYFKLEEVLDLFIKEIMDLNVSNINLVGVFKSNEDPEVEKIRYISMTKLRKKGIPVFRTIEQAIHGVSVLSKIQGEELSI